MWYRYSTYRFKVIVRNAKTEKTILIGKGFSRRNKWSLLRNVYFSWYETEVFIARVLYFVRCVEKITFHYISHHNCQVTSRSIWPRDTRKPAFNHDFELTYMLTKESKKNIKRWTQQFRIVFQIFFRLNKNKEMAPEANARMTAAGILCHSQRL